MTLAAILFALAALGGATLLTLRLRRGANPPLALAVAHGALAVTAFLTLLITVVQNKAGGLALVSVALFAAAAVGGLILVFGFHRRGRLLPVPLILGHGLLAVSGFVVLLVHMCQTR